MRAFTVLSAFALSFITTRSTRISSLCLSLYSWSPIKVLDIFPLYFLSPSKWLIIFRCFLIARFIYICGDDSESESSPTSNSPPLSARLLKQRLDAIRPIIKSGDRTLDDVPQDVALIIASYIQDWATGGGVSAEREKKRLARDSALRAMVLTSRNSKRLWQSSLLLNVTFSVQDILSFHFLLEREARFGSFVKTFHYTTMDVQGLLAKKRIYSALNKIKAWSASQGSNDPEHGISMCLKFILEKLDNLQSLRIDNTFFQFPLQTRINGKLVPLPFFTASLKRLFILLPEDTYKTNALSASNVVWLLTFSPNLKQASLGCSINYQDFNYLSEFQKTFSGLSNVEELALRIVYTYDLSDRNTWWGLDNHRWKGGNKKTEALINLLQVTKELLSLEVSCHKIERNPGDDRSLYTSFISGLHKSFTTLERLRLMTIEADPYKIKSTDYSVFKNLKLLAADEFSLKSFLKLEIKFPSSIESLSLPHFICDMTSGIAEEEFEELVMLSGLLKSRRLPRLKEVVVPALPIRSDGREVQSARYRKVWTKKLEELKIQEVFKTGRAKLRFSHLEEADDSSKREFFMSYLSWLFF